MAQSKSQSGSGRLARVISRTAGRPATFALACLIQSSQNRDTEALQVKLDELIRTKQGAQNALLDLEQLDEAQLDKIRARYEKLAEQARKRLHRPRTSHNH